MVHVVRYIELTEDGFGGMLNSKVMHDAFAEIKRDCGPYLKENSSPLYRSPLYRGMPRAGGTPVIKKQVRLPNRKTTDLPD